jgi:hypothetical protein
MQTCLDLCGPIHPVMSEPKNRRRQLKAILETKKSKAEDHAFSQKRAEEAVSR